MERGTPEGKLREHLIARGTVAAISRETLRRILRAGGVSWQTTTTWKASTDPDFIAKMHRILDLYDHPPRDGRVVCVDEFGPLNLQPRKGKAWRPVGKPARQRATYNRHHGVMHMLAALDLATGKIYYRIRDRKRHREFLDLLKVLRRRWPGEKLYITCDNFSPHRHPKVRAWCATNDVELVFLPTYGSWLNWIEAEFAALRYFALNGTRPPQPRRTERRDRGLHPLAQRPRPTQDRVRYRLTHPNLDPLPNQGCVTSHCSKIGVPTRRAEGSGGDGHCE
ncbi:IS630 family transposase [Actinophytocola sp. NPDC049390]|uniref:IS630 family transposase n=1 Tax=Actinophytocola sp. NPDC049390 TaxID=3363894 RepID=UPI003792D52C